MLVIFALFVVIALALVVGRQPRWHKRWVALMFVVLLVAYQQSMLNWFAVAGVLLFYAATFVAFVLPRQRAARASSLAGANTPRLLAWDRHLSLLVHTRWVAIAKFMVLLLGFALGSHQWPGFSNPLLLANPLGIVDNKPLYFSFDKAMVGVILFASLPLIYRRFRPWLQTLRYSVYLAALAVISLLPLALLLGVKRWQPGIPEGLGIILCANLLVTCAAEEAFFRGFIQREIQAQLASRFAHAGLWSVVVGAALFGLAHVSAGWTFALLAAAAGVFYGAAYRISGRLEAALLTHFLVNLTVLLTSR